LCEADKLAVMRGLRNAACGIFIGEGESHITLLKLIRQERATDRQVVVSK